MSATATTATLGGDGRNGGLTYLGAGAPTADNDTSNGFHVGDRWVSTTLDRVFNCVDDTAAAAVWSSQVLFNSVAASSAISNTTTETAFDQSYTIPADYLSAGSSLLIRGQVIATGTNGSDTLNVKLKIGSTTIVATGALDATNNDIAVFDALVTVRTAGTGGTLVAAGIATIGVEGSATMKPFKLASTAVNTTTTQAITVTGTWSAASTSDSCRLDQLFIARL